MYQELDLDLNMDLDLDPPPYLTLTRTLPEGSSELWPCPRLLYTTGR